MELRQVSLVLAGSGFTPQTFHASALAGVIDEPATQPISTPVVAVIDYPSGYHVIVLENRLEVRLDRSPAPDDARLGEIFLRCVGLWPIAEHTGLGLNFVMWEPYSEGFSPRLAQEAFLGVDRITAALEAEPTASEHSFQFPARDCKITLKLSTHVERQGVVGLGIDCNVHRDAPEDIAMMLRERAEWTLRCEEWGKHLVGISDR